MVEGDPVDYERTFTVKRVIIKRKKSQKAGPVRTTKLRELRPGVFAGNIDVSTPSGEDFYQAPDRVAILAELARKKATA